jgi:hypothetical protein
MATSRTKSELAQQLSQFLLVQDVQWQRLRKQDLLKLELAFQLLKADVLQLFEIVDQAPLIPVENNGEWKKYTS